MANKTEIETHGLGKDYFFSSSTDFASDKNDRRYTYRGKKPWEDHSLRNFKDLREVSFGENFSGKLNDYRPSFDFIVNHPGLPQILVTQEHNRLLYECENGLLEPSDRRIFNVDAHDDFWMNSDATRQIHIGTWGAAGIELGHWKEFVHFYPSEDYTPRYYPLGEYGLVGLHNGLNNIEYRLAQYPYDEWRHIGPYLGNFEDEGEKKYILSIDVDTVAKYEGSINPLVLKMVCDLLKDSKDDPNLELLHIALSPSHCLAENGIKIFNQLRKVLLEEEQIDSRAQIS